MIATNVIASRHGCLSFLRRAAAPDQRHTVLNPDYPSKPHYQEPYELRGDREPKPSSLWFVVRFPSLTNVLDRWRLRKISAKDNLNNQHIYHLEHQKIKSRLENSKQEEIERAKGLEKSNTERPPPYRDVGNNVSGCHS
jgi:hypothetical protein